MARRRRSYRGMVTFPGLGFLPALKGVGRGTDIFVGAAAGVVGGELVTMGLSKANVLTNVPAMLVPYLPSITSLLAGVALYYGQKKSNPGRAQGHLIGATAAAIVRAVPEVKRAMGFSDVVSLNLSRYGSVFVDDPTPRFNGLIVDDPNRSLSDYNLAQLASASLDESESNGLEALMDE